MIRSWEGGRVRNPFLISMTAFNGVVEWRFMNRGIEIRNIPRSTGVYFNW